LFGAEQLVPWKPEEKEEFEKVASARLRACVASFLKATAALTINIALIVPFLAGHRFHNQWNYARYLLFTAEALLLWFVIKAAFVWSAWQSARETRREFEDLV
jgi:hypothetical protein